MYAHKHKVHTKGKILLLLTIYLIYIEICFTVYIFEYKMHSQNVNPALSVVYFISFTCFSPLGTVDFVQ